MLRSALAVALIAAGAFASAASPDEPDSAGFLCGFTTSGDPTGVVEPDPHVKTGELDCGPWAALDVLADDLSGPSASPGAAYVTICGTIQVNQPDYDAPAAEKVTHCGEGIGVAVAAGVVRYRAEPQDWVYLCTRVTMVHDGATTVYAYDSDDDPANGIQCGLSVAGSAQAR